MLIGQEGAETAFRAALSSGRVGGAYLLHGPHGVGRRLGAETFAAALLCEDSVDGRACGGCRSCRWTGAGTHPDLLLVTADTGPFFRDDGAAERGRAEEFTVAAHRETTPRVRKTIPVRTLRRLLDLMLLVPAAGGRRVVIVDAMDEIEDAGTATLLKILEDSPPRTSFLLIAGSVDGVQDTIRSRCQRLRFRPLRDDDLSALLLTHGGDAARALSPEARTLLVRQAQGSLGRALSSLDLELHGTPAKAARALLAGARPGSDEALIGWVGTRRDASGKERGLDTAAQRERARAFLSLAGLLLRDHTREGEETTALDRVWPAVTHAMESIEANVKPETVLRALWARVRRAAEPPLKARRAPGR